MVLRATSRAPQALDTYEYERAYATPRLRSFQLVQTSNPQTANIAVQHNIYNHENSNGAMKNVVVVVVMVLTWKVALWNQQFDL